MDEPPRNKSERRGRVLRPEKRTELLALLERGVSRSAACRKLGIAYASYLLTREQDPDFDRDVEIALSAIDQNVAMALYKSAMEGSVTAQTFWLKSRRPEGWDSPREPRQHNRTRSQPSPETPQPVTDEELANLSDRELIERARAEGVELPPEIARRLEQAYRQRRSPDVPPEADD